MINFSDIMLPFSLWKTEIACMFHKNFDSYDKNKKWLLPFCLFSPQICIYPYHREFAKGWLKVHPG